MTARCASGCSGLSSPGCSRNSGHRVDVSSTDAQLRSSLAGAMPQDMSLLESKRSTFARDRQSRQASQWRMRGTGVNIGGMAVHIGASRPALARPSQISRRAQVEERVAARRAVCDHVRVAHRHAPATSRTFAVVANEGDCGSVHTIDSSSEIEMPGPRLFSKRRIVRFRYTCLAGDTRRLRR